LGAGLLDRDCNGPARLVLVQGACLRGWTAGEADTRAPRRRARSFAIIGHGTRMTRGEMQAPAAILRVVIDHMLETLLRAARWLAPVLAVLLFLQWPLRELVQAYSREANDLAQIVFAFYVGLAVTAATRARAHLVVDSLAAHRSAAVRAWLARGAAALIALPWAALLLVLSLPGVVRSIALLEGFPETYNPGYFLIKVALIVLAAAALLQALLDVLEPFPPRAP
jgi:TRAP-type mannitol/chloroaromatic compound transport system permease small subunit